MTTETQQAQPEAWKLYTGPTPESATWPYVIEFARRMEAKLELNRHKGDREGWLKDTASALFLRLETEVRELREALVQNFDGQNAETVSGEAADVANFAMMIADVSRQPTAPAPAEGITPAEVVEHAGGQPITAMGPLGDEKTAKSNRWWWVWETELEEEGRHLFAAETSAEAELAIRKTWGPVDDPDLAETEVSVEPAADLDHIEKWLRCEDPKDMVKALEIIQADVERRGKHFDDLTSARTELRDLKEKLAGPINHHRAGAGPLCGGYTPFPEVQGVAMGPGPITCVRCLQQLLQTARAGEATDQRLIEGWMKRTRLLEEAISAARKLMRAPGRRGLLAVDAKTLRLAYQALDWARIRAMERRR